MKKILFFLFFATHLVSAQIKPLKFALQSRFNPLDFPENKRVILTQLNNKLFEVVSSQMDSIAKTKSKCMTYIGTNTKKADIICMIDFYKEDFDGYINIPMIKYSWIDAFIKDTLKNSSWAPALRKMPKTKFSDYELQEKEFAYILEEFLFSINITFNGLASCENITDYKLQKQHEKEVVFVAYPTASNNKKDKKLLELIDNIVNNQLVARQITNEKYKHIERHFIFYPYNKETKNIKPDITIQLQLVDDNAGNYELIGEFKGKEVNFQSPHGEQMQTSIKFNKKRLDKKDYTELVYKLNFFMRDIYLYNISY